MLAKVQRANLGVRRIFARIYPNLAAFLNKFSLTKMTSFWCDLQKKGFSKTKTHMNTSQKLGAILSGFSWIFGESKLLGMRLHPSTPASYSTACWIWR